MAGRPPKPEIRSENVRGAKYLKSIMKLLRPLRNHKNCHNRTLHYDEFIAYSLLYFFNPIVTSLRGLSQMSKLELVGKKFKLPRFAASTFSEASRVFDPTPLVPLLAALADEARDAGVDVRLTALAREPIAVDGTLIRAVPKMAWATWCDDFNRAAKAHVQFSLLKGVPTAATVTEGNASERRVLLDSLAGGKFYIFDRGYVQYALLAAIVAAGSSFLGRMKANCAYEVVAERPLSAEARARGVVRDLEVTLGSANRAALRGKTVRLVEVHVTDADAVLGQPRRRPKMDSKTKTHRTTKTEHTLLLATDDLALDAGFIADLYQHRWQIELFFRWFKTVLKADYLISQSQNGLTLVVYCGLIASLLVALWTSRKPTKRTYEMFCFYLSGWATEDEVEAHIEGLAKNDG
ncbi:IS4 family transposase [bacterium]|nr:IS4 family transposase [bacterium]